VNAAELANAAQRQQWPASRPVARFPVVTFDLDGTLLRETTVCRYLGDRLSGGAGTITEVERRYRARAASSFEMADGSAPLFAGHTRATVAAALDDAPWIGGMAECLAELAGAGCQLLLGTLTWRFAAEWVKERHGFAAVCGTTMREERGALSGRVERYFDEHDKLAFIERWCASRGTALRHIAAVGDSWSDVPLFRRVGMSIALNATGDAQRAARCSVDTDDLRDILPLLIDTERGGRT
jgi:phosphoserine phosphatase